MDETVRNALRDIVARHGRDYLDDSRRCAEAVRENLGPALKREAATLNLVLQEGVPQRLLAMSAASLTKTMIVNSAVRISEETGLREDLARWAIETWAESLGLEIGGIKVGPPPEPTLKRDEPRRQLAIGLDRPDIEAKKALAASVVAYAISGFDLLIFIFLEMPPELGLDVGFYGGSLMPLVGAVVGGILFGMLSDHYGRVRVLTWTILLSSIGTGLCAVAQGDWGLIAYSIAAFGMGGEFVIGMALVAEAWPARLRARACSYVALGWPAGMFFADLVIRLVPNWRVAFLLGLVSGLVAAFLIRGYVREPKIFIERAKVALDENRLKLLAKDTATVKVGVGMLILCAVQGFGSYSLLTGLPIYLFAYDSTMGSFGWTLTTVAGTAVGIWAFGEFADRVGRRPALIAFQAGAIVTVLIYSQLDDPTALLSGVMLGVFAYGMLGGYGALLSELYPTQARGTAGNVLFNVGRAAGGLGPFVIFSLAPEAAIGLLVLIYVIAIIATALLIPERKGVMLD